MSIPVKGQIVLFMLQTYIPAVGYTWVQVTATVADYLGR